MSKAIAKLIEEQHAKFMGIATTVFENQQALRSHPHPVFLKLYSSNSEGKESYRYVTVREDKYPEHPDPTRRNRESVGFTEHKAIAKDVRLDLQETMQKLVRQISEIYFDDMAMKDLGVLVRCAPFWVELEAQGPPFQLKDLAQIQSAAPKPAEGFKRVSFGKPQAPPTPPPAKKAAVVFRKPAPQQGELRLRE